MNENILFISDSKEKISPIIQKLEVNSFDVQLETFENQINLCATVARGTRDIILSDYNAWTRSGLEILKMIEERDKRIKKEFKRLD